MKEHEDICSAHVEEIINKDKKISAMLIINL
jgi:predicted nucleic acid-binding Zn ribbon protein